MTNHNVNKWTRAKWQALSRLPADNRPWLGTDNPNASPTYLPFNSEEVATLNLNEQSQEFKMLQANENRLPSDTTELPR